MNEEFMKSIFVGILTLMPVAGFARPLAPDINPLIFPNASLESLIPDARFEGIVGLSNCSGALVAFKGMPKSKKALVMTNGHCVPGTSDNVSVANQAVTREFRLFDSQMKLYPLTSDLLIYGTLKDTDLAFYRTTLTYEEIEKQFGVEALTLDDQLVPLGTKIDVVSGLWREITSCEVESIVPILREDQYVMKNSVRYSETCKTRGGFSGSPVIEQNTRTVVAIHNTGNNGKLDCSYNNPCEQNENGELIFQTPRRRYAQQFYQMYGCLDENFDIDLGLPSCNVAKP